MTVTRSSAVTRVFGITELLEKVLIALADQVANPSDREIKHLDELHGHSDQLEPTAALSRVLAVDRTFRATIIGSNHLQHLMLQAFPSSGSEVGTLKTLQWLFNDQLDVECYSCLSSVPIDHLIQPHPSERLRPRRSAAFDMFVSKYSAKEATWRRVKVARSGKATNVVFQYFNDHSLNSVTYNENATLGEVFKRYHEFLTMAIESHRIHEEESAQLHRHYEDGGRR